MIVWQNMDALELFILRSILPQIPRTQFKTIDQIERASSSIVANFIEGYYSGSLKEYLRFLGYSRRSLAELQDWGRRVYRREFIPRETFLEFDDLSIRTTYLLSRLISSLKQKLN
jgi:four helix bundle protein